PATSSSCGTSPTSPTSSSSARAAARRAEACTTRWTTRTATTTTGRRTRSSSASSDRVEPTPTPPPVPVPRPPPPLVSWIFLGICVLVFLPHAMDPEPPDKYLLDGPAIAAGEWWRVLTSNFEHVTPLHILFNGLSIFSFGPVVERQV